MTSWSVNLEAVSERPVSDDDLERFAVELVGRSGVVTGGGGRYGARLSVEAAVAATAVDRAAEIFQKTADAANLPPGLLVRVEAITEEELDAELDRPAFPELVGVTEIAQLLVRDGAPVSRQRASSVTKRPDFPAPVAQLAAGPVWTRDSVRNFVETWERKPGRPKLAPALVLDVGIDQEDIGRRFRR